MALTATGRGSGNASTSVTSWSISPASNCTAGATVVLAINYDNAATNGADPFSSISDSAGNTWTLRENRLNDPGAVNEGVALRVYETTQNAGTLTTSSTITVSLSTGTTARAYTITEVTASAGSVTFSSSSGSTGSSTTPSITTGTMASGELVIGCLGSEGGTPTADSDTSNGSWSTMVDSGTGGGAGGQHATTQNKVVTGSGTQTWNPTLSSSRDWCIAYLVYQETATTRTATTALTGSSTTISASATFAPIRTASATLSGGSTTLAASATFAAGTKTATASLTGSSTTLAASATFAAGTKTATASLAGGSTTISASATFTPRLNSTARGTSASETAGTSLAVSPASNCTAGATIWLAVAYDNAGTNGADPYSSISDTAGNTWTVQQSGLNDPAGANDGVAMRLFTTRQNAGTLTTSSTITISFSTSVTAKAWAVGEVSSAFQISCVSGAIENDGSTVSPSVTTGSLLTGDVVVGVVGLEDSGGGLIVTGDGDASGGSWSTVVQQTSGSSFTGIRIAYQTKLLTSDGSQTFNPTIAASGDVLIGYLVFREVPYSATAALSGGSTTLAVSATFSDGAKTASASLTTGSTSLSATVTVTNPSYTASASLSGGSTTLAATATFSEEKTAVVTLTGGSTVLAAVIDVTNPTYAATAALTTGSTTLAAVVAFTRPAGALLAEFYCSPRYNFRVESNPRYQLSFRNTPTR